MRILYVAIFAAFALAGCGGIDHGTVIGKKHEPEATYTMVLPIQTGSVCSGGTTNVCTPIFVYIPFVITDNEDWKLRLRDGDKEGWAYVSQYDYEHANDGDYFDTKTHLAYLHDPNNEKQEK